MWYASKDPVNQRRGFVLPTTRQEKEITHPRATLVAERRRQGDAERETARTRPLVDVLVPERERLSANHRRHRPSTRMLLHLEQSLDLVPFRFRFRFRFFNPRVFFLVKVFFWGGRSEWNGRERTIKFVEVDAQKAEKKQ